MNNEAFQYRLLEGFEDPSISPEEWNALLPKGSSDEIFLTWHWQKIWWDSFGRGQLLLIAAAHQGKTFAIAPFFAEHGMVYFVGSGGSDYLDFVGDVSETAVLENMLGIASQHVQNFSGFQFYHIPETAKTNQLLQSAADMKGWRIYNEGGWPCPRLDISRFPEQATAATRKKSLLRHEAYFRKTGVLKIEHAQSTDEITPHLDHFFEQHVSRWATTPFPSLFLDEKQKRFFIQLTDAVSATGWLRFTKVIWNDQTIAYHFGFHYKDSFFWYKPTFNISLAKHSPGEVLLRNLLLKAQEDNASVFDFGLGDENFKDRFATSREHVINWGLYPSSIKNEIEHEQYFSH